MSNTPQGAESPLAIVDRRLCARRPVPSLAYVDLGEDNGGIILNIGEGGLAVTSVAPLYATVLAQMRFQLPGSSDWLEAGGEIARISESRKVAGLRFVDLSEEARDRIKNWVSSAESSSEPEEETAEVSEEKEQLAVPPPTRPAKSAIAQFTSSGEVAREAEGFVARRAPREEPHAPDHTAQAPKALQHSDRRAHARKSVSSLTYVDLGGNNGGIILNIGEGGMAVASAAPLDTGAPAQMRFQLPGSNDWLEANGKIARISESKKEAGLLFVDLSEDAHNQINGWVSSDAPAAEFPRDEVLTREKAWRRLDMPIMGIPHSLPPQTANRDQVTRERTAGLMSVPTAASMPAMTRTWLAASAPTELRPRSSWEAIGHGLGGGAGVGLKQILQRWQTWVAVAVVLCLGAFLAGWFTAGPGSIDRTVAPVGNTASNLNGTANDADSHPENLAGSVAGQAGNAPAGARTNELAPASTGANVGNSAARIARSQEQVLEAGRRSAAANDVGRATENATTQGPGNVAAQNQDTSGTASPSPSVNQPEGARTAGVAQQESSPAPKPAEIPEAPETSVSVSFDPFPSIRVPAGLKSQMSQRASLQIGQLLSRVDPVYPEDAQTQQVEGTVKLHAIIGANGAVESVETRGGPALLITAAENAVRQWRFTPSSIGGQPVGAEENIAITFRLATQTAHPN